ncbi:serine/threonine protein kinase, CMGC, CDC2/CDK sub [Mycoblastus sanguinarius]|nr:serine/threonine protein kinase, CMGC, CDC2/CDK sub [Mycoblastus sanguinarius]
MSSTPRYAGGQISNGAAVISKRTATQASLEVGPDGKKPRFHGCSRIGLYVIMSKLGEGTFGEVHKAESRESGQIVAMKKILMHNEKDGFPITALREIKLLKMLSHPNVLKLEEMAVERTKGEGRKKAIMYMVTPYMDHDLSGLLENPSVQFTEPQIKCYMLQLLEGVAYLHASKILHRDMKAANLLINNQGILQIADFGLARPYDDPPPQPGKGGGEATRDYTTLVVTRWYRPPELLLQLRRYTSAIDMWGVGCVFGEMFRGRPILPGNSDVNQTQLIFELVGSPNEDNMPGWSSLPGCDGVQSFQQRHSTLAHEFREQGSLFISLLGELLKLDWRKRINAIDALDHSYFKNNPLPAKPGEIPQFQESHELDRKKFREQKANLPPAPAGGTVGMGPDGDFTNGSGHPTIHGQYRGPRGGAGGFYNDQQVYAPRQNGYDNRYQDPQRDFRRPPPPPGPPPPSRRPAWAPEANGLPPRPPPPSNPGFGGQLHRSNAPHDGGRARPTPRECGGGSRIDTYIPSYANREDGYRDRDDVRRGREDGTRRDDRGDRGRQGDRRDQDHRDGRRRSRSPDRGERDRNRELYRR